MTYKYVSLGMNLGRTGVGKVSYLHDSCAIALNLTLGPKAEKYEGEVPPTSTCPYCREPIVHLIDDGEEE